MDTKKWPRCYCSRPLIAIATADEEGCSYFACPSEVYGEEHEEGLLLKAFIEMVTCPNCGAEMLEQTTLEGEFYCRLCGAEFKKEGGDSNG